MSPNVGNFVHDLVEMAKAMETLPQVQAELEQTKGNLDRALETVQSRELRIIDLNATIAELNNKVRSLEVERDDASFRVLEAEDQSHAILAVARVAQANLSVILATLDPPKPQPEPEQPPIPEAVQSIEAQPQVQSATDPTIAHFPAENSSISAYSPDVSGNIPMAAQEAPQPPASPDQGEVNPTTIANAGEERLAQTSVTSSVSEDATLTKPYANKLYSSHPTYVSYWDWLDGGGTDQTYHR